MALGGIGVPLQASLGELGHSREGVSDMQRGRGRGGRRGPGGGGDCFGTGLAVPPGTGETESEGLLCEPHPVTLITHVSGNPGGGGGVAAGKGAGKEETTESHILTLFTLKMPS